jgi:hypothetical protein
MGFIKRNSVLIATTLVGAISLTTAFYEATRPLPVPPPPAPPEHMKLLDAAPSLPQTTRDAKTNMPDLTSNPLAGTTVEFRLVARDAAGHVTLS